VKTPDLSKLPQWAQKEIARWKRDAAHWQALAERRYTTQESDVAMTEGAGEIALPPGSTIKFRVGADWEHFIEVRAIPWRTGQKAIDVRGGASIKILPRAGNAVAIAIAERDER